MSLRSSTIPLPGPARLTLVALVVVPAIMGYPWSTTAQRIALGVGVVVPILLLGWAGGLHFTTIAARRIAMMRSPGGEHTERHPVGDQHATAALRITPTADDPGAIPLELVATYLDRYGLQAETVRLTSRDSWSDGGRPVRDNWIGLTYSAAANLPALQARSTSIPLQETADVAVRRLADHLRELGWEAAPVPAEEIPEPVTANAQESWRSVVDGSSDYLAAYRVGALDHLGETLARLGDCGARETWTVIELAGAVTHPTVAVACALRTAEQPTGAAPLPELIAEHGNHRTALRALDPLSGRRIAGHTELTPDELGRLRWATIAQELTRPVSRPRPRRATAG